MSFANRRTIFAMSIRNSLFALLAALLWLSGFSSSQAASPAPVSGALCSRATPLETRGQAFYRGALSDRAVDVFRVEAQPGAVAEIAVQGESLSDPYLGVLDSGCSVLRSAAAAPGRDKTMLVRVPTDGQLLVAISACCDASFVGFPGAAGEYTLSVSVTESVAATNLKGKVKLVDGGLYQDEGNVELYACETDQLEACEFLTYQIWDAESSLYEFELDAQQDLHYAIRFSPYDSNYLTTSTAMFEVIPGTAEQRQNVFAQPRDVTVEGYLLCDGWGTVVPGNLCIVNATLLNRTDAAVTVDTALLLSTYYNGSGVTYVNGGIDEAMLPSPTPVTLTLLPGEPTIATYTVAVDSTAPIGMSIDARILVSRQGDPFSPLVSAWAGPIAVTSLPPPPPPIVVVPVPLP